MPFYEYINDDDNPCQYCREVFVISQSMVDNALEYCPQCKSRIKRLISRIGGIVMKNREANQYSDIKYAKYWRDKNGIRHKVTSADGTSKSATVSKQTASPQEVVARKKHAQALAKKRRNEVSYNNYKKKVLKDKKQ